MPRPRLSFTVLAALAVVGSTIVWTADAGAQRGARVDRTRQQEQQNAFSWSGDLAAGRRVVVRNLIGNVTVEAGRGRTLEVSATKRWRRGRPAEVTIDATRSGGDVVVCARWTAETECTENGYRVRSERRGNTDNDVQVDFVIRLPAGASAVLHTTIGEIDVTGASGAIDANTTNGDITVETSDGPVEAATTNGDIEVRLPRVPASGAAYRTVNGDITIVIPEGTDANVEATTVHGQIDSDFPVTISGSIGPHRLRGTIGRGGPLLRLSTVNGDVRIERR